MSSHPFAIVSAFTSQPFRGNPAAIVFLTKDLPSDTLLGISQNFNQPIVAFVSKPNNERQETAWGIRYFTTGMEVSLCGHGTLAAAKAMFADSGILSEDAHIVGFVTSKGVSITVTKVKNDCLELELPSGTVNEVSFDEGKRLRGVVARAIGKSEDVIKFIGCGSREENFQDYLLIELDEKENLAEVQVDPAILAGTEPPYLMNVFTAASPNKDEVFVSRMFAPFKLAGGASEDHVCGSTHCLLTPYWSQKLGLKNREIKAKQVSARGGDLKVLWEGNVVRLRGDAKIIAKGDLFV